MQKEKYIIKLIKLIITKNRTLLLKQNGNFVLK